MKLIYLLCTLLVFNACEENGFLSPNFPNATGNPPSTTPTENAISFWLITSLPLDIKISDAFTANEAEEIVNISEEWNKAVNYKPIFYGLSSRNLISNPSYPTIEDYENDPIMGIYKSPTWFSDMGPSTLALTASLGYRRMVGTADEYVQLIHADIILNTRNHQFSIHQDPVADSNTYDLPTVVLHELGHVLGLDHISGQNSVMNPRLAKDTMKRSLYPIDVKTILAYYPITRDEMLAQKTFESGVTKKKNPGEGDLVRFRNELHTNGECVHYLNNKLTYRHFINKIADRSIKYHKSVE